MQVRVSGATFGFRGGDAARVHLGDRQGGSPCCVARCQRCCTHSLPQVASAGRNLITVFSAVNNPREIFSRTVPAPARRRIARTGGAARGAATMQAAHATRRAKRLCRKRRVLRAFRCNAMRARLRAAHACASRCARAPGHAAPGSGMSKRRSSKVRGWRAAAPRKRQSAQTFRRSPQTETGRARRPVGSVRSTGRCPATRQWSSSSSSSAYASGSSISLSWSGSSTCTTNSQPSP